MTNLKNLYVYNNARILARQVGEIVDHINFGDLNNQ